MGRILVSGPPGSGKTTFALRVADALRARDVQLAGFTTAEIRRGGRRTGFTITGMNGLERQLAARGGPGPQVGAYGVDVKAFEEVALLELESGLELGSTLVVDEIGKMELLSERFADLLPRVFAQARVFATVQQAAHPVTDPIKRRGDVRIVSLDADPERVADLVLGA